jgi:DNA-binding GntR family transcriptional regulator
MKKHPPAVPAIVPSDKLSISELADIFGFPVAAFVEAINRNRQAVKKPFYSIPELAKRWNCSRATVYNVLRESELKALNVAKRSAKKGKWNVPADVVEHIELSRIEAIPESAAA